MHAGHDTTASEVDRLSSKQEERGRGGVNQILKQEDRQCRITKS